MSRIKCFLIDDDKEALIRLSGLINKLEDIEIVGKSTDTSFVVDDILVSQADMVFLAVETIGKDGFEIIDEVRAKNHFPVFIITSAHSLYALRALKYAVFDYLLKPIDFNELKVAINRYRDIRPSNNNLNITSCWICNPLSTREKEVLSYIIKGLTSLEISKRMFISVSTVNFHRQNILLKTGAKNFSELSFKISETEKIPVQYKLN